MYGSPVLLPYICLLFLNIYHFACVWPTALKLGCITNSDMLFLVMGLISFDNEIQFMLISSCHICIRSIHDVLRQSILCLCRLRVVDGGQVLSSEYSPCYVSVQGESVAKKSLGTSFLLYMRKLLPKIILHYKWRNSL